MQVSFKFKLQVKGPHSSVRVTVMATVPCRWVAVTASTGRSAEPGVPSASDPGPPGGPCPGPQRPDRQRLDAAKRHCLWSRTVTVTTVTGTMILALAPALDSGLRLRLLWKSAHRDCQRYCRSRSVPGDDLSWSSHVTASTVTVAQSDSDSDSDSDALLLKRHMQNQGYWLHKPKPWHWQ